MDLHFIRNTHPHSRFFLSRYFRLQQAAIKLFFHPAYLFQRPRQRPRPLGGVVKPALVSLFTLPVRGKLRTDRRVLLRTLVAQGAEPLEELPADRRVRGDADVAEGAVAVGAFALEEVGADGHALGDILG